MPSISGTQPMPLVLGHDGSSALVYALFVNCAALLVVGVDPSRGGGAFPEQTLLDLAIYDYKFGAADDATADTWLAYLMRASKAEGRKGPEVAWTMRHRGAKTSAEIAAELDGTA